MQASGSRNVLSGRCINVLCEGQILDGTYRLVRVIGQGGMGVVYEATHARLAGRYAVKVLLQKLSDSPEALARFDREARITSLLQHPNVVQVIDHNRAADGTEYLVMEYLAGESLAQRLAWIGRLSREAALDVVHQIASGLAAAHARGVVHRDLKPENIFLVPIEGRELESVKILDFGISKIGRAELAIDRQVCGTPQYMAPEQIEARVGDIGGATDQFALAVIAYEILTGRNPFTADNVQEIFLNVARGVPSPTGLGPSVDQVLRRGLAKSNRKRFPSVTEFDEALRAVLAGVHEGESQPTLALAVGELVGTEAKPNRRRGWGPTLRVAVGASLATLVLLDGGGIASQLFRRARPTMESATASIIGGPSAGVVSAAVERPAQAASSSSPSAPASPPPVAPAPSGTVVPSPIVLPATPDPEQRKRVDVTASSPLGDHRAPIADHYLGGEAGSRSAGNNPRARRPAPGFAASAYQFIPAVDGLQPIAGGPPASVPGARPPSRPRPPDVDDTMPLTDPSAAN